MMAARTVPLRLLVPGLVVDMVIQLALEFQMSQVRLLMTAVKAQEMVRQMIASIALPFPASIGS